MKTRAFNIALPEELVKEIDRTAKSKYQNRSEFIRDAVVRRLEDLRDWEQIFQAGQAAAKRLGIKSEADVNRIIQEYRREKRQAKSRS